LRGKRAQESAAPIISEPTAETEASNGIYLGVPVIVPGGIFVRRKQAWVNTRRRSVLSEKSLNFCGSLHRSKLFRPSRRPEGFQVLPKRWVVERTFAWFGWYRRLSKDYERLLECSEICALISYQMQFAKGLL
jgi:transposase